MSTTPAVETFEVSKNILNMTTLQKEKVTTTGNFTPLATVEELQQFNHETLLSLVNRSLRSRARSEAKAKIVGADPSAYNTIFRAMKLAMSVDGNGKSVSADSESVDKVKTRAKIVAFMLQNLDNFEGLNISSSTPAEEEDDEENN